MKYDKIVELPFEISPNLQIGDTCVQFEGSLKGNVFKTKKTYVVVAIDYIKNIIYCNEYETKDE
jgi:hypothetical protein